MDLDGLGNTFEDSDSNLGHEFSWTIKGITSSVSYAAASAGQAANSRSQCACSGVFTKQLLASGYWVPDEPSPRNTKVHNLSSSAVRRQGEPPIRKQNVHAASTLSSKNGRGDPGVVMNKYNVYRNSALQVGGNPKEEMVFAQRALGDGLGLGVYPAAWAEVDVAETGDRLLLAEHQKRMTRCTANMECPHNRVKSKSQKTTADCGR
ncbi:hypothetical protein DFH08DRAFT_816403 [Mycena albidolilacea]|uniref:Uncharacterized protein n=1 Tax=Mycena albidolilacea TaxID=1033008 RepID=A0AAD7EJG9_9AGAR|nr:hypothetical protein DFH08DRAFT_816403 [Mycena albidolilacea]